MLKRSNTLILIAMLAALAAAAKADGLGSSGSLGQGNFGGIGGAFKKAGGGGACSNKLDFSQPCNSQYVVVGPMR